MLRNFIIFQLYTYSNNLVLCIIWLYFLLTFAILTKLWRWNHVRNEPRSGDYWVIDCKFWTTLNDLTKVVYTLHQVNLVHFVNCSENITKVHSFMCHSEKLLLNKSSGTLAEKSAAYNSALFFNVIIRNIFLRTTNKTYCLWTIQNFVSYANIKFKFGLRIYGHVMIPYLYTNW